MYDLTAFQRDLLHVMAGLERPYGLEVKRQLETYYETDLNHGRLYPNLDELAANSLIDKGQIDDRTNWYALTDKGYQLIESRREWENQFFDPATAARTDS